MLMLLLFFSMAKKSLAPSEAGIAAHYSHGLLCAKLRNIVITEEREGSE